MSGRNRNNRRVATWIGAGYDSSMIITLLFLIVFGIVMIYSASSYEAFQKFGDAGYYTKKQVIASLLGLGIMIVIARMPYYWLKKTPLVAYAAYLLPVVLTFLVLTPLGVASHGAKRWIKLPGIPFNLQPAEIVKMGMIIFCAVYLSKKGKSIQTIKGTIIYGLWVIIPAFILGKVTNNMSSAIIVVAIAAVMYFVANPHYKFFIAIGIAGVILLTLIVLYFSNVEGAGGFRGQRIRAWLDPESQSQGTGFQTVQALYAIASGGIWGKGLGNSMQKLSFIPEAQNDMIFSIICEELGLFGAICVIALFAILLWRMMDAAIKAPDMFGTMLVVGVMGHIGVQAVLNIAVVTNTIPNTGVSLPFISYGGSSVMFLLFEVGIVLSVANGKKVMQKRDTLVQSEE